MSGGAITSLVANKIANEVICLPMHHELNEEDIDRILNFFRK